MRLFAILLALVSLLASAAGAAPPAAETDLIVEQDVLIPTPDGAQIAAIVVRPRGATRTVALLEFTIYADDRRSLADATKMAERGYAGVVAYTRGKGRSPGPTVPYERDGEDAATVIDWIARQAWSDGRVGMFGGSYNSFAQWAAAKRMPRALKALATSASNAPGIDTPMWRGVFLNFVYPWPLYTTKTKTLDEASYGDTARWAALNRTWYLTGRAYREMEQLDREPNPVFAKWLQHPTYDAYWQAMTPQGREFAKIDIPVLAITGYFDGGAVGVLHYLREHLRYRPDADHRLLVGPYHHFAMGRGVLPTIGNYDVDPVARVDLQELRLQWFDHVFRGRPLPALLAAPVNFEVMGANTWNHAASLDRMGKALRFYMEPASPGTQPALGGRPRRGATDLTVDLSHRGDVDVSPDWGPIVEQLDTRNAIVFRGAPLERAMDVNGTFRGRLQAVTNKRDFDFGVSFYEQTPDGRYFALAWSVYRASQLRDRRRRDLLVPGRSVVLPIEGDQLTSRRLSVGSRIVVVVWVPKESGYQINYGAGKDVSDESVADAGAPLTLSLSGASWLELRATPAP